MGNYKSLKLRKTWSLKLKENLVEGWILVAFYFILFIHPIHNWKNVLCVTKYIFSFFLKIKPKTILQDLPHLLRKHEIVNPNTMYTYRVSKKNRNLKPETSLKSLMLQKLLDQSTFAYWALLDLIFHYYSFHLSHRYEWKYEKKSQRYWMETIIFRDPVFFYSPCMYNKNLIRHYCKHGPST